MNVIAQDHLANSSKDVSNGGLFGTILQLIQYSEVGADINIEKIVIPPKLIEKGYNLETYVKMFLTTSYILTAPQEKCERVIKTFKDHNMSANLIGKIIEKTGLKINNGKESLDVI